MLGGVFGVLEVRLLMSFGEFFVWMGLLAFGGERFSVPFGLVCVCLCVLLPCSRWMPWVGVFFGALREGDGLFFSARRVAQVRAHLKAIFALFLGAKR